MVSDDDDSWWEANQRIRDEMSLPDYEPPRFVDGVYTHSVISDLEDEFDCTIYFVGRNTTYPDDWEIMADGTIVMEIPRQRTDQGNTVYTVKSDEFRERFREEMQQRQQQSSDSTEDI